MIKPEWIRNIYLVFFIDVFTADSWYISLP